jgi:hypothetical protein
VSAQTLLHQWAAMLAVDAPLERAANGFQGGPRATYSTPTIHAAINWSNPDAYSTPGAPPNGSDYVRLVNGSGQPLTAKALRTISFNGSSLLPTLPVEWTVDADPPDHAGNPALHSGSGDNFDRAIITPVTVPTDDPTLRFTTSFDTEELYDYGFVQVSTDGGASWTSLGNDDTTTDVADDAVPQVIDNLPGFNGTSDGWLDESFDLSAYAGQDVLLSFRYITDSSVQGDGWWVDDVSVGATAISDGSSLDAFQSQSEVRPTPVSGFTVQLVGYPTGAPGKVFVIQIPLNSHHDGTFSSDSKFFIPASQRNGINVVAAIITYDDPTETITQYAPYTLTVNGVVQPGSSTTPFT